MSNSVLVAGLAALGIAAISLPFVSSRLAENERVRKAAERAAAERDASRMLAEAIGDGRIQDVRAIREQAESAWPLYRAQPGGRGAGGVGPRYAEAAFRRTAMEYVVGYLLARGALPTGAHRVKGEWIGTMVFPRHGASAPVEVEA